MVSNPSNKVKTEAINGVILRLLGLNPGVELDYQTYNDIIKKKLVISNIAGGSLPREEEEILREELKRVRRIKDKGLRFKVKTSKAKVSTGATPGPGVGGASPKTGAIVKAKTAKIVPQKIIPVNVKDVTEKKEERVSGFDQIKKTLNSILSILESKFKFDKKQSDQDRKDKETEKRSKRESGLEGFKRGISAISGAVKKVLAPFQSIIDRIWKFIFFTLLGRAFTKFMEWLNDKGNQEKFNSFIEFLSDHFPALAGLYVLFGTSFGKLVRGLLKGATRMIVALAMNIGKIRKFVTKNKKIAFLGAAIAPLAFRELGNIFGENKETPESKLVPKSSPELDQAKQSADQATNAKVPTFNLGGMIPKFNLGGMLPSFAMGAMNPFGGMDFQSGVPITGAGKDDTLIAAKTGEAIVTEKDQRDISQRYVDKKTGEPLNIPQYLSGRKPGKVSLSKIGFPGFSNGGVIQAFNTGGIVGKGSRNNNRINRSSRKNQAMRLGGSLIDISPIDTKLPRPMIGFRDLAEVQYQNNRGIKGLEGGGLIKMRAENPKMTSSRSAWDALDYAKTPLKYAIGDAKKRLFDLEGFKNRNIDNNIRPWWERINPFRDKRTFADRLPGKPIENYRMPGFDLKGWSDLKSFRESPDPYKPNPKNPKIKYAPGNTHRRPGIDRPLMLQGGGEIEALEKTYIQGQKSGMSSETLKTIGDEAFLLKNFGVGGTWRNFRGSGVTDYRGNIIPKKQGGGINGLVKENTGFNVAGATADRQRVDLQPGEYVLTRDFVDRVGVPALDKLVAYFDSNSNPAKLGVKSKNIPNITPLPRGGSGGVMTLPPIIQSASGSGNVGNSSGAGSRAPVFSAVSASGARQISETASILGIVG